MLCKGRESIRIKIFINCMQHLKALRFIIYSIATRWRRAYYIITALLCYHPRNRHYSTYSHYVASHSSYYPIFRWFRPRRRIKCTWTYRMPLCMPTLGWGIEVYATKNLFIDLGHTRHAIRSSSRSSHFFSRLKIILWVSLGATTLTCGTRNIGSGSPRRIMYLTGWKWWCRGKKMDGM